VHKMDPYRADHVRLSVGIVKLVNRGTDLDDMPLRSTTNTNMVDERTW
jgi:hypothetical protein